MSNEDISWVVKVYWGKANREELYEGADWKNKWDNIADGRLAFESAIGTDSFYKVELIEIDCGEENIEDEWEGEEESEEEEEEKEEEELPALQFPPHGTIEYDDKGIKVMWDENEGWVEQEYCCVKCGYSKCNCVCIYCEKEDENTCDCCVKGWTEPNEFGLCQCCCYNCYNLLSDCRYKCRVINPLTGFAIEGEINKE
jgi:hypothetical protein